jgi:hypothetical protein
MLVLVVLSSGDVTGDCRLCRGYSRG